MKIYDKIIANVARRTFGFWETLGLHVTPVHFYEPIPDTRSIAGSLWDARCAIGVEMNDAQQVERLTNCYLRYKEEYEQFPRVKPKGTGFWTSNPSFGSIDAEVLYCTIRSFQPKRIVEVGSGYSTFLAIQALRKNGKGELLCIEPYPNEARLPNLNEIALIRQRVQDVPLSLFESLEANDILFIDSSHVLSCGSDVAFEFLEILPRLKNGVLVHFHDIFLPGEYPKEWIFRHHRFWNEQYLLQAFLSYNQVFEVIWGAYYMHTNHPEKLGEAFDMYDQKRAPGSFWIRRTEEDARN
jgi:predicted O-methyltransferase YrrM